MRKQLILEYFSIIFFSLHFCLTYNQSGGNVIHDFLDALREICNQVINLADKGNSSKTAAIYGMAGKIPDKSVIEEVAHLYLDACYSMPTADDKNGENGESAEMDGNGKMIESGTTQTDSLEEMEDEEILSAN